MMMKSPQTSKINWIALAILVLSFFQDPKFLDLIPPEVGLWITRIAALLVIIIRTIFTQVACVPPVQDPTPEQIHNMPADVKVDDIVKEALNKVSGRIEP
jgi:hypothetical protein